MPLTLTLTEGVLPVGTEKEAVKQITDSLLKTHGLSGNTLMTPNITANVHIVPKGSSFSGGKEFLGAWAEWKVPSFALADDAVIKQHFAEVTEIIFKLSGGKQPKDNIYVNVLHAVDGGWNLDGVAMTNEELGEAISKG
ncbi:MAG: 4-oxalocrotonate tautomerase [Bacteroidetes bacterium]|nr:MAG: 4-oxalocrotonate tautomerase [Bacteroidota bacterium]